MLKLLGKSLSKILSYLVRSGVVEKSQFLVEDDLNFPRVVSEEDWGTMKAHALIFYSNPSGFWEIPRVLFLLTALKGIVFF